MDDRRFDDFARALAAGPATRRRALRLLGGTTAGGLLTLLGRQGAAACTPPGGTCSPNRPGKCCSGKCSSKKKCLCTKASQCPRPSPDQPCKAAVCNKRTGKCGFKNRPPDTPCPVASGTGACDQGQCRVATCDEGFGDCNDDPIDGCETDTRTDARNCGRCGNVCPGLGQSTANASCVNSTCQFSCRGDHYDVDNNPSNGCERPDDGRNNHTRETALPLGSKSCDDGSSRTSFLGRIVSDARQHNPSPPGFAPSTGSAPDWYRVRATGGTFCINDLAATIRTTGGSSSGTCYRLTVITNNRTPLIANVSGNGVASIPSCTSSCYPDNSDVFFTIEKTCNTSVREDVGYTVEFHL